MLLPTTLYIRHILYSIYLCEPSCYNESYTYIVIIQWYSVNNYYVMAVLYDFIVSVEEDERSEQR